MTDRLLMIVEDHLSTRRTLGGMFSRRGWEVCLAPTIAEALSLLDHGLEPDCLVLDLMLPDGDGEQVLRRVRALGLKTRVAVCTATSEPTRLGALRGWEPDALLIKPIDADVLCNLCEHVLETA
jgi:two-component system, OmpR family, response regulator